ncbi:glycosyltransferase family 2 protein [Aquipuribacter hungaricus]|uniref:Glycosyltransferase family 2 protein n=1 Tax=Aquipuribacter hungaricus TaxID=545624 RepID=A0ABV7WCA2_9MICO
MDPSGTGAPASPPVTVVVATRDRPQLVVRAVESVLAQRYDGEVECVVVFDQSEPHPLDVPSAAAPGRRLVVTRNDARTPGLAGARNTGILAATGEVVGFLDDDDEWLPGKLQAQLALWQEHPDAVAVATGIVIRNDDGDHPRPAPARATFADFLRSRIIAVNPCTVLVRREDLLGRVGLVDEGIPGSYGEDYEWLLRATRHGDVVSLPEPYARINWNRPSFFVGRWEGIVAGLTYLLGVVPEFDQDPRGRARIEGQLAFASAALGRRREALGYARRALRHRPLDPRALASVPVGLGLVRPDRLVAAVQRTGRGL